MEKGEREKAEYQAIFERMTAWFQVFLLFLILQDLASHFRTDWFSLMGWGLVTKCAQLLITSDYYLPSTSKDRSTMRAELTGVIAN